jgi:hypothetical protein
VAFVYRIQRNAVVPQVIEVIDDDLDAYLQDQASIENRFTSPEKIQVVSSTNSSPKQVDITSSPSSSGSTEFLKFATSDNDAEISVLLQRKVQEEAILQAREDEQAGLLSRHLIDVANVKAFIAINRNLEIPPAPPVVPRAPAKQTAKYVPKRARAVLTLD